MKLPGFIKERLLLRKWKKYKKRGKTIRLKISQPVKVLQEMDALGIRYVVLRWPNEVPVTPEQASACVGDVDMLIDIQRKELPALAKICAKYPGTVPCDVYSLSGHGGLFYRGFPYYPPTFAEEILKNREMYNSLFYVPDKRYLFYSLSYHLVYQKGLRSGIPTGCDLKSEPTPKRDYQVEIEKLGRQIGADIELPYTLIKLHNYLKKHAWNMPYDLMERLPDKDAWLQYLLDSEIKQLRPWAEKLPGLLIFFIRACSLSDANIELAKSHLAEKFDILRIEILSNEQIDRIVRLVRGGNWLNTKRTGVSEPKMAILCYDHRPQAVDESDANNNAYPLVRNQNVFIKHHIRSSMNLNNTIQSNGIHGSDNEYESQYMLSAIYGESTHEVNEKLLMQMTAKR